MGTDGFILPLWRRTALRLLLKESRKRHHLLAMWFSLSFSNNWSCHNSSRMVHLL